MLNAFCAALDRVTTQTLIAVSISYGDYPRAERLIGEYVDAELARVRATTHTH